MIVVDTNHSNSGKRYEEQFRIAREVCDTRKYDAKIRGFVRGLMIESYLEDGAQAVGGGVYGRSITDPCLGWVGTEELVLYLAENV
jgi:3-deoxy-7-phosphoheptulonate synthase